MFARKVIAAVSGTALALGILVGTASAGAGAGPGQAPLARSDRASGIARSQARGSILRGLTPLVTCSTPGAGNYKADCNSAGRPTNETTIANNGSKFVAGANDYNSYNGNAQLGFYTSADAKTWTDNGPLDLYPHSTYHAAGDPGLAIDSSGVVYYSNIFFDYFDCNVGGVELARQDPSNGSWSYYQIAANSDAQFQDKPSIMQSGKRVFVAWTQFGSCTGIGVTSPIIVAVFPSGPTSVPPSKLLTVPGSTYSQGAAMTPDGSGGFWITWEEYPDPLATVGSIKLAHFRGKRGWSAAKTISPAGFTDLPSPLPGFAFRDNSFPMIASVAGQPKVVWTSYDTGVGRCYLWSNNSVTTVSNSGGDQFFPAVAADSSGLLDISFSQTQLSNVSYDRYLSSISGLTKVSTASSFPNSDPFFGGAFIGDYEAITVLGATPHPIWTDVRGTTFAQNAMVYSP